MGIIALPKRSAAPDSKMTHGRVTEAELKRTRNLLHSWRFRRMESLNTSPARMSLASRNVVTRLRLPVFSMSEAICRAIHVSLVAWLMNTRFLVGRLFLDVPGTAAFYIFP